MRPRIMASLLAPWAFILLSGCVLCSARGATDRLIGGATDRVHQVNPSGGQFRAWLPDWFTHGLPRVMHRSQMHLPHPTWGPRHRPANLTHWAQCKEDRVAFEHFFYHMAGGTYLEMGALTGAEHSNTLFEHAYFNWRGLLIEASPVSYDSLAKNRPGDICINAAVCDQERTVHYLNPPVNPHQNREAPGVHGIYEFMNTGFRNVWYPEVNETSLKTLPYVIEVPCFPLRAILGKLGITHVDFFSLDVEGAELAVLQTLDFNAFSFSVIAIELNNPLDALKSLLHDNGYVFYGHFPPNVWFHHKHFIPRSAPSPINATVQVCGNPNI